MSTEAPTTARRPSETVRARALEVRRANRTHRIDHLRATVHDAEHKVEVGSLGPQPLTHEYLCSHAGISPATYWRYLQQDEQLRAKAAALTGKLSSRCDGAAGAMRLSDEASRAKESGDAEIARLMANNVNLKQQLAVCKTVIGLMDVDLRAKTKEVASKDFLLAAARAQTMKVATLLKELADRCLSNGLEIGDELSGIFQNPLAGQPENGFLSIEGRPSGKTPD